MDPLLEQARAALAAAVPHPYLQALLTILAFLLLAKVVDWLIAGLLSRLAGKTSTLIDDQVVSIMHRPVFASVAMIGLILATHPLDLGEELQVTTIAFVQSLLILVWLVFAVRLSRIIISAMRRNAARFEVVQETTEPFFTNSAAVLLFLTAAYAVMRAWEINVTGLIASAGIAGLALGFAAQDTLANLFAGIAILTDQPYKIGDYIIIDSGERGQVTRIGLRSTSLLTRDDVEISIPNGVMGGAKIVNEAGGPPRLYRISASVGVAYGSDIDHVMAVLIGVASAHEKVLAAPEPRTRFRAFGDSSLDFDLLCWIASPADRGLVVHELNCEIYRQFGAQGVEIPFPQRDVHIRHAPAAAD